MAGYSVLPTETKEQLNQAVADEIRGSVDAIRGKLERFLISIGPGPVISNGEGEEVGSYTNTHGSGKKYHGKGPKSRAKTSG